MSIFTIKQGNKTLSTKSKDCHYVIGFKSAFAARKVQYSMQPEPDIMMLRCSNTYISLDRYGINDDLVMDANATLFIPKCKGSTLERMNDGGFHLYETTYKEFLDYPFIKNLGVIIPHYLTHEDEHEFAFKSVVIDPLFGLKRCIYDY